MLEQEQVDTIRQKRMDALSAKHLHEIRLASLNRLNRLVDCLAIAVPVLYIPVRYLAKGSPIDRPVEVGWELLAACLVVAAVLKLVYGWPDRAARHSKLIGENISLASQADQLLSHVGTTSYESVQWFLILADNLEKQDREALGAVDDEARKHAYREALKELSPGRTMLCPECNASPWHYTPGTCQLCGNTPVRK